MGKGFISEKPSTKQLVTSVIQAIDKQYINEAIACIR